MYFVLWVVWAALLIQINKLILNVIILSTKNYLFNSYYYIFKEIIPLLFIIMNNSLLQFEKYINNTDMIYQIINSYCGHTVNKGCKANQSNINPYFHVLDMNIEDPIKNQYIIMECNKNIYTKLSLQSITKMKDLNTSWFICKNGYIATNSNKKQLYLHQFITNYYGHGKGQDSVDHINRDKLDNRIENLRIVSQSIQNENQGKRQRKYNAQELPPILKNVEIPKYVYYCSEVMHKNKPNEYIRDFFRIEKHPNLNKKIWCSSKSTKKNLLEKFIETKDHLYKLDNNIIDIPIPNKRKVPPGLENIEIPKYIYYCSDVMNKGKSNEYIREFFSIENHPKLNKKKWCSSKSKKKTLLEKFNDAKNYLDSLN